MKDEEEFHTHVMVYEDMEGIWPCGKRMCHGNTRSLKIEANNEALWYERHFYHAEEPHTHMFYD